MRGKLTVIASVAAAALCACGGGGSKSTASGTSVPPPTGGSTIKLSADPSGALKFTTSAATASRGQVVLTMSNPAAVPHGVALQGPGINKSGGVVQQGGTSTVTANLKPGVYTFYCPVPGHRQAGMQGTLTVR